jgi:hypothetical protein
MKTAAISTLTTHHIADALALCNRIIGLQTPPTEADLAILRADARWVEMTLRIHSGIEQVRVPVKAEEQA